MKKKIFLVFIFFFFIVSSLYAQENSYLNELVTEGIKNNPGVQSAYFEWQAAKHKINQAGSFPDLTARYTHFGQNIETRVGPQINKYGVSQKVPFFGKRGLKEKSQQKTAEVLKENYEAAKRKLIKDIKVSYYDIFWVDKAIRATEEEKTILESLEEVAQRKYESNLVPQQDVVKAQVELSRLIDKLFQLQQNRKSLEAKINLLLNRQQGKSFRQIDNVDMVDISQGLEEFLGIAQDQSQELLAANLSVDKAEYEKSLARLDYFPDFTFGLDYINIGSGHTTAANDGEDAWMATVSINIPLWFDRLNSQLNEKKAKLQASINNYKEVENKVSYEVQDKYYKVQTYKDIISLYKTALMPQTMQAFETAKTGYEAGKTDFLNWLDAERVVLQTRLAYYKAVTDYLKSLAYLEMIVGKDLNFE